MAFSVKDFWSYTDDPSTLKDLVLLVAKPGGGGFSLINMTKEEFFNIANTMAIKFNPASNDDLIILNDTNDVKLRYLLVGDYLFVDNLKRLMFSDDGSTNEQIELRNEAAEAKLTLGGSSPTNGNKKGLILLYTDAVAFGATIQSTVTSNITASLSNIRKSGAVTANIQYREDSGYAGGPIFTGASTDIPQRYYSIYFAAANGGGIATHTFNMPVAVDGDRVRLAITGTITTVTMATPGSETIQDPFTSAGSAFQAREWIFSAGAPGEWKRIA